LFYTPHDPVLESPMDTWNERGSAGADRRAASQRFSRPCLKVSVDVDGEQIVLERAANERVDRGAPEQGMNEAVAALLEDVPRAAAPAFGYIVGLAARIYLVA
jgi:hypothetical protein